MSWAMILLITHHIHQTSHLPANIFSDTSPTSWDGNALEIKTTAETKLSIHRVKGFREDSQIEHFIEDIIRGKAMSINENKRFLPIVHVNYKEGRNYSAGTHPKTFGRMFGQASTRPHLVYLFGTRRNCVRLAPADTIYKDLISTLQLVEKLDRYPLRNKSKIHSFEPEETSMNVKKEGTQSFCWSIGLGMVHCGGSLNNSATANQFLDEFQLEVAAPVRHNLSRCSVDQNHFLN
ncbi:hypothetical protein LAZ67_1001825 [Cordylochernes scorpioides]|uniref:Uncharacterized protein n=1 Tax=Cordylochernes scorpioides TaxID=51811 RepID=A0ABY6JVP9_9ARAC|nr:hypothetical protein LAZ67_1001825 [Cordylochernes scorpioides]